MDECLDLRPVRVGCMHACLLNHNSHKVRVLEGGGGRRSFCQPWLFTRRIDGWKDGKKGRRELQARNL